MQNIEQNKDQSQVVTPDMTVFDNATVDQNKPDGTQQVEQRQQNHAPRIEIDPQFADLDQVEGTIRTLQSRFDKTQDQYKKLNLQLTETEQYKHFMESLLVDDDLFEAFVSERKPDLIKPRDLTEVIQKRLADEFGAETRYTRAEADQNPGGKAWLYFKRLDELYDEVKGKGANKLQTVKELRVQRQKAEEANQQKMQAEIARVKQIRNWDDTKLKVFHDWSSKLTIDNLASMFDFAMRNQSTLVPNISQAPPSDINPNGKITQAREQFLKGIF